MSTHSAEDDVVFPVYRKYPHNRTFFKVLSEAEFEELSIVGGTFTLQNFKARIFSVRVFLHDLIYDMQSHWESIEEGEYEDMKMFCLEYMEEMKV
ncbi:MAG: hypothetical protein WD077_06130 [Bacteroidia bacterium]